MPLKSLPPKVKQATIHGAPCSVGQVYRKNVGDPEEILTLNALLYEEGNTKREVWEELKAAGYEVGISTVSKHRGGTCRCFTIDKDICCEGCRRDLAHCACDAA